MEHEGDVHDVRVPDFLYGTEWKNDATARFDGLGGRRPPRSHPGAAVDPEDLSRDPRAIG